MKADEDYTLGKEGNRGWSVLKGGQVVEGHYCHKRKRDAIAAIEDLIAYDKWLEKLLAEDRAGTYTWSEDEEKQINEFAELLKANEERWTFCGKFPIQKLARDRHKKDAEDLTTDKSNWVEPDRFFAETRRRMAARVEAFKRAGVEL